jgi:hypothetical protein
MRTRSVEQTLLGDAEIGNDNNLFRPWVQQLEASNGGTVLFSCRHGVAKKSQ